MDQSSPTSISTFLASGALLAMNNLMEVNDKHVVDRIVIVLNKLANDCPKSDLVWLAEGLLMQEGIIDKVM